LRNVKEKSRDSLAQKKRNKIMLLIVMWKDGKSLMLKGEREEFPSLMLKSVFQKGRKKRNGRIKKGK